MIPYYVSHQGKTPLNKVTKDLKMTTDFNALDKVHAAKNSDDRANRGVTLLGGILALAFSAAFWAVAYFIFFV